MEERVVRNQHCSEKKMENATFTMHRVICTLDVYLEECFSPLTWIWIVLDQKSIIYCWYKCACMDVTVCLAQSHPLGAHRERVYLYITSSADREN